MFFFPQVREILGQCSCPAQFPMIKVSEGKYKVGDSSALIFIRVGAPHHRKVCNLVSKRFFIISKCIISVSISRILLLDDINIRQRRSLDVNSTHIYHTCSDLLYIR